MEKLTLKNETRVMWGIKLWAPFQPQADFDFSQNISSWSKKGPTGQAYKIYSLGQISSIVGSLTCANNQSEANCTPRFPVAANAFSLKKFLVN